MKAYPIAKKVPVVRTLHGVTWTDEYAWLQDAESPEVRTHLTSENAYADAHMKPHKKHVAQLYAEMKKRMKETDMSVPVQDGPYEYYTRTKKGKQYALHCRKHLKTKKEEVLLDENVLAKDTKYFNLGLAEVSPDHTLLAYSTDTVGDEKQTLVIKNLGTGALLEERIEQVADMEWAEDGRHFFYTVENHPHPPRKVYRHRLGTPLSEDVLVYEELDQQWYVFLSKSNDERYIFIGAANFNASEIRVVNTQKPDEKPVILAPRVPKVKYWVEHHDTFFYILSNEKAVEYKIMRTADHLPERSHWKVWMKHNPKRSLGGFIPYKNFFGIPMREEGSEQVFISNPSRTQEYFVRFPEKEHSVSVWGSIEFDSPTIRLTYTSFLTPRTVWDHDVATHTKVIRKQQKVPQWDAAKYTSRRLWCSNGGVKIPVVMVHKKNLALNGKAPLLLQAYGSYGICQDPAFSITTIPLLERGWIVAIAQPRGGGEMGNKWHEDAKMCTKHRTYDDVIAVTDALVKKKVCARKKMVLVGGSAGGMMVGAVLNKRPDCVGAAIAYVPAADTLTSMLDESLGGTRLHYDEIGDPRKKEDFLYIKKTSPYEGVRKAPYPPLLVRASLSDIRTPYWEAAKWVARLRAENQRCVASPKTVDKSVNEVFFKVEMSGGHFGKSGRYEYLKERAWDFAFIHSMIG